MENNVTQLIADMQEKGWSVTGSDMKLIFTRDDITITGHQEHVIIEKGDYRVSRVANRYWPTLRRQEFLLASIRELANLADKGEFAMGVRWRTAQNEIEKVAWSTAYAHPEALELIEQAVAILQ